jgi:hypothetical protein
MIMQIDWKGSRMSMRRPAGVLLRTRRARAMRKLGMTREVRGGILVVGWWEEVWVVWEGEVVEVEMEDCEDERLRMWMSGTFGSDYVVFFYWRVGRK